MHSVECVVPTNITCYPHIGVSLCGLHLQARGFKVHQKSTKLKMGTVLGLTWLLGLKSGCDREVKAKVSSTAQS